MNFPFEERRSDQRERSGPVISETILRISSQGPNRTHTGRAGPKAGNLAVLPKPTPLAHRYFQCVTLYDHAQQDMTINSKSSFFGKCRDSRRTTCSRDDSRLQPWDGCAGKRVASCRTAQTVAARTSLSCVVTKLRLLSPSRLLSREIGSP